MFRQLNIPILGVVENMSHFVCGALPGAARTSSARAAAEDGGGLKIPLLGEVPIDTRVRSGGDEGQPIVAAAPEAPAAKAFGDVAGKVAAQISIQSMRVLRVVQTA